MGNLSHWQNVKKFGYNDQVSFAVFTRCNNNFEMLPMFVGRRPLKKLR